VAQVALVTPKMASRPVLICIESWVPHLGLMVADLIVAQVLFGEASVHARNRSFMVNDWPHMYPIWVNCKVVVSLLATGPPQPWIALVEETVPLLFRITRVPQNAKAVLVEPVLLYIVSSNGLYTESPDVHVLQESVPGKEAPVSVRSLEVQEDAAGNVVVICAKAFEENKQAGSKRTNRFLMIILSVKGWVIPKYF
jgi:hypothetical protein